MEAELIRYGYWFIAGGSLIESDATLLTASFLAHRGYFKLLIVFLLAALGSIATYQAYFWLGMRQGDAVWRHARVTGDRASKILEWVHRHGDFLVLGSRFVFGLKFVVPAACGVVKMSGTRYFALNVAGAILWTVCFGTAGYLGSHALTVLWTDIRQHEVMFAGILLAVLTVYALLRGQARAFQLAFLALTRSGKLPAALLDRLGQTQSRSRLTHDSNPSR